MTTTEIYNYIILSIVVLAYLHLWFYTFKYQKIEKKIENRINERFEDFIWPALPLPPLP